MTREHSRNRPGRWRRNGVVVGLVGVATIGALVQPASMAATANAAESGPAFSLQEGQAVRGQVTVYAGGGSGLRLTLDDAPTATQPEPSLPATVLFEADGVQSGSQRLLNSLWVNGQMVSLISQDYSGYATAAVSVPAGVLHEGANVVTVRAGSSVSPTDLTKNHDDFTIRNVRLRLLGGTDLADPSVPSAQVIPLGDGYPGGNATEEQVAKNFTMTVPAEQLQGVSAQLDTRQLADGAHTLTAAAADGQTGRVGFRVDNTPPVISSTSPAEGERIGSGDLVMRVDATDAVSGMAGATAVLDGRSIPVPNRFPVENIPPGDHTLAVTVTDKAGNTDTETVRFTTAEVPIPRNAYYRGLVPSEGDASGDDAPVLLAAGDVACAATSAVTRTACHQAGTATLVQSLNPDAVAMLADGQYDVGTLAAFQSSYDKTWGAFKDITYPVVGNHEYAQAYYPGARADGFYDYFNGVGQADGRAGDRERGYYSYNLGRWHVVALNGECGVVSCAPGSGQYRWLEQDLQEHPNRCTLVYWHKPIFSALTQGGVGNPDTKPLWRLAHQHGIDVVLNGHDHNYQRYAPQDADGKADPTGIREFVVGTGGVGFHPGINQVPNLEVTNADTFGVLKLTLRPTGYEWAFVPERGDNGTFTDAGSGRCTAVPHGQAVQ